MCDFVTNLQLGQASRTARVHALRSPNALGGSPYSPFKAHSVDRIRSTSGDQRIRATASDSLSFHSTARLGLSWLPHRMGLCCATDRSETTELRCVTELSETSELKTFQELQMNQWLGKFWNAKSSNENPLRMVLIGERQSIRSSFLSNVLGTNAAWIPPSHMESLSRSPLKRYLNVNGVCVVATLVPSLSDAAGYKDEMYIGMIQDAMQNARRYNLVIFCVNMSDTRLRGSVFRTFQELKTDWSRTVIVLTFADALPALMRHRENPVCDKGQYFNTKLAEWTRELKAMLERVGVQQEVIANMNMYPCANEPEDLLPNGESWLAPLSLAIMEILSPQKKAEFLEEHAMLVPTVAASAKQPATLLPTIPAATEALVTVGVSETTEVQSSKKCNVQVSSASSLLSEGQSQSISRALSKLRKECPKFGVLVIGRTGVGKSTLINNLLGKEVASVGHTLRSETPTVNPHEGMVEGVPIAVYDTPGLGDIKGEEEEAKHLCMMKDLLAVGKIHLVVYCFQMNKTIMISSHVGPLCKYHKIGVDWKRSVIALTFADALYVPESDRKLPMSQFFDERLAFWRKQLKKELVETVGVNSDVVERLEMYPTTPLPKDQLPNGNPWYVPLWLHIVEILSPAATVRFLDIHRNNICDEQTPPPSKRVKVEVNLNGEDRNQLVRSVVAAVEATGMVSDEDIGACLTTALKSGIEAVRCLLVPEQACQSGIEPNQREQEILHLFRTFGERFVNGVRSRDNPTFTSKLQYQKVIPESLKNQIAEARENGSANWLLFEFLCEQATCESLRKLLAAMIETEDHPAMSKLGGEMKAALGL